MGILDIFGGGSPEEKARKLRTKITQKYGDPTTRQKAIAQLGEMDHPEAVRSLMARFTVTVDPHTTDADEKDHTFELVKAFGQNAVAPVREFLERTDAAASWALRVLSAILPEDELIGLCTEVLQKVGNEYTRDPEKKVVLIHHVAGRNDPRVPPALVPFLEDPSDDVKIAALSALAPIKYEPARVPMMQLITTDDVARRVKAAAISAAHESAFSVEGFRDKVQSQLSEPWFIDGAGLIKKRA